MSRNCAGLLCRVQSPYTVVDGPVEPRSICESAQGLALEDRSDREGSPTMGPSSPCNLDILIKYEGTTVLFEPIVSECI